MTVPATILLVEDDPLLRDAFRILLEDAGYRVVEAGAVAEALGALDETPPTLVLLDLGLPDGPGLDVVRAIRRRADVRDIPVVALTGRVGPEERDACIAAGCSEYLAKPVEPLRLLRLLPRLLGERT